MLRKRSVEPLTLQNRGACSHGVATVSYSHVFVAIFVFPPTVRPGPKHGQAQAPRSRDWREWHGAGRHSAFAASGKNAQPVERDQERRLWQVAYGFSTQLSARL